MCHALLRAATQALLVCLIKGEKIVHLSHKIQLLILVMLALSSFAFSQVDDLTALSSSTTTTNCAAPTYGCARSDLITTNNQNPPPAMGRGKNAIVTPSDFKLPIVRVTDGTLFQNKTMTVTLSGSNGDNIFSTDDSYLMVIDQGGWKYPIAFNPSTMQTLNTAAWTPGSNQVRFGGSGSFSRTTRNVLYTVTSNNTVQIPGVTGNDTTLFKLTLSGTTSIKASGTKIVDFAKCPGMRNPYNVGNPIWRSVLTVSAGDKRFAEAFSNQKGGQDTGTDIVVYDAPSGQCYHYDTAQGRLCTSSGCAPMSLPDEYKIHEVYMSLDGKYLRIAFSTCTAGGCFQGSGSNPYFWQIGTTNVTRCYTSLHTANCSGHMVEGYTHIYNASMWPQTAKRAFTDPLSYTMINPSPTLTPNTDEHYSNNAADPYDTHPFWVTNIQNVHTTFGGRGCNTSGNVYLGCTFPGPLFGEVYGIRQNGGYIRAAHTYNTGSSTYFNCSNSIGAVSQTGRFFAFSSDWLNTLGKDNTNMPRCDVFIVNLAAAQGAVN
jgi:hypothetical protein